MNEKRNLPIEYVDNILFDLVKEFYMQRGDGAKFRTVWVGRNYFEKFLSDSVIVKDDFRKSLASLCKEMPKTEIVEGLEIKVSRIDRPEYYLAGYLVEAEVKGCAHLWVEKSLKESGLYTYVCPILNVVAGVLEKTADSPTEKDTELVSIEPCIGPEEKYCRLKVLLTQGLSGRYVGYADREGKELPSEHMGEKAKADR